MRVKTQSNNTPPGTPRDLEAGNTQAPQPHTEADDLNLTVDRHSGREKVRRDRCRLYG